MRNFKESVLGLIKQMDNFVKAVSEEKQEKTDFLVKLLLLLSTLLDSIKEKIIIELDDIQIILAQVKPVTDFLAKKRHISKAKQYHDDVINICNDLKQDTLNLIQAYHHESISKLSKDLDVIIQTDFVQEKEDIDELLVNLNHKCRASLLKWYHLYLVSELDIKECEQIRGNAIILSDKNQACFIIEDKLVIKNGQPVVVEEISRQEIEVGESIKPKKYTISNSKRDKVIHECISKGSEVISKHIKEIEKEITGLKIKLINAVNIKLINLYPLPNESAEQKLFQIQTKAIDNIFKQLSRSGNQILLCHFVRCIIQKTLKSKRYDIEWKKNLLCLLFDAYEISGNSIDLPSDEKIEDWQVYRIRLKESREKLNQVLTDENLFKIDSEKRARAFHRYSEEIKKLVEDISARCTELICPPPVEFEFCLVALGSMTRKELLPYSDLECLFLVADSKNLDWESEKPSPQAKYLECWFKFFQFYIASFGESTDDKPGFRLDGCCDGNVGLVNRQLIKGNPSNPEFRKTPNEVIEILRHSIINQDSPRDTDKLYVDQYTLYSLLHIDYIGGSDQKRLFNACQRGIQELTTELTSDFKQTVTQEIALRQLEAFRKYYDKSEEKTFIIDIKSDYWQSLVYPMYSLALYFNLIKFYDPENSIATRSTFDILSLLQRKKNLISPEQLEKFQITIADLYQIRFKLHHNAGCQREIFDQKNEGYLRNSDLEILSRTKNDFLMAFYGAVRRFIKTKNWFLDSLPQSYEDLLKVIIENKAAHEERLNALEIERKQSRKYSEKTKIEVTPVYHILANDCKIDSQLDKLENQIDLSGKVQSHITVYADDQDRLVFVVMLFVSRKRECKKRFLLEELLRKNIESPKSSSLEDEIKKEKKLEKKPTEGNGDCPFHAVLGEWDEYKGRYICSNVEEARKKVKSAVYAIAESKESSSLQDLVLAGIKAAIMDNISLGKSSDFLLVVWREFREQQKKSDSWDKFKKELEKYPDIVEFINKHGGSLEQLTFQKYSNALNKEDGELRVRILSLKDLEEARRIFDEERSKGFDWEIHLNQDIRKEYGDYIARSRQWLLPHELGIIAIVFKITVYYYASSNALPQIYNKGHQEIVQVQYEHDGRHYSRLVSRRSSFDEIVLNEDRVKKYLDNEFKIREMAGTVSSNSYQATSGNYERATFGRFFDFCLEKRNKFSEKQVKQALVRLLCIIIEKHSTQLSFVRTTQSDQDKNSDLSRGQTIQFKFALPDRDEKNMVEKVEGEIIEEIGRLNKAYTVLTILFQYSKDNNPTLTGYIYTPDAKYKELVRYPLDYFSFKSKMKKYLDHKDYDSYKRQIERFWEKPSIRRKWQEASIKLIEEEKWLMTLYNAQKTDRNKIELGFIRTAWFQILEKSVQGKKNFRRQLERDQILKPILFAASQFAINVMLFFQLTGHALFYYREDPDLDDLIEQKKINQKLVEENIMLLKLFYHNLILFKDSINFDKISGINKLSTLISVKSVGDIDDKFYSAISLMYIVLKMIINEWNHRSADHSQKAWLFFDPWADISRHIPGFGSLKLKDRQQIINNLTFFHNELEKNNDFSKIQVAGAQQRLYNQCDLFFKQ